MGSFRILHKFIKRRRQVMRAGSAGIARKASHIVRPSTVGGGSLRSVAENQGRLIRLFRLLQRQKAYSLKVSLDGILGLAIVSCALGVATLITEAIMKLKHPIASAALLSIESPGLFVACLSLLNGATGAVIWKVSRQEHRPTLTKLHKSLHNLNLACSFGLFALSLIAVGIYATLRDWQHKLLPMIHLQQQMVKVIGQDELSWPEGVLEEIYILKMVGMNCHLLIFITSAMSSVFCAVNLFVGGLPNYGACADAISVAYKRFKVG
ncbi:uncharacterized protein LOC129581387 [Paramacrobiotus metropolitanus]|uniref:uncharacterized protein LOC129581387 n=1 Tax=Paramacrobiotus metropolitanus TaxID=2943436 RepID=UPI002445A0F3|nr:uncharacterized protein LOC129581387 [Paramacrobiotus metropolitanus]